MSKTSKSDLQKCTLHHIFSFLSDMRFTDVETLLPFSVWTSTYRGTSQSSKRRRRRQEEFRPKSHSQITSCKRHQLTVNNGGGKILLAFNAPDKNIYV